MPATILMIGTFDSKGKEYAFLRDKITGQGLEVLALDVGVGDTKEPFPIDVNAAEVALAAGSDLSALQTANDRGQAIKVMAQGAAIIARKLHDEGRFQGIVGMGGSGGTSIITAAMRALPVGVPKVCVSTMASADTSPYVGEKDITLIPSVADIAGINQVSRTIFTQAAGAICGMVQAIANLSESQPADRTVIATTMFGNTTACVDHCRRLLEPKNEVLVFHATGTGGRAMESLINDGLVDACLDITTTEWADTVCDGIMSAGKKRLSAAGEKKIPHLIVPGCIDMVNFGSMDTVPTKYRNDERLFYEWSPEITLMRTNEDEIYEIASIFAEKANDSEGPVAFLIPNNGFSLLGAKGERFHDRKADGAFIAGLVDNLAPDIPVVEIYANINDPIFAEKAVQLLDELIEHRALVSDYT